MILRDSVENTYKWGIDEMFPDSESWEREYGEIDELIKNIKSYAGKILDSKDNLLEVIKDSLVIQRKLSNLYSYSRMKLDENTKNNKIQEFEIRAESLATKASEGTSFIVPEILNGDIELINSYIGSSDELKKYDHYLMEILRYKPHTLSQREELIVAMAGEMGNSPQNTFGMLSNADLKFESALDSKGEEHNISHGTFIPLLKSKDRTLRKNAFENYYKTYIDHKNTFAMLINSEVKKNIFYSKVKRFPSSIEASLFSNNVPINVYDNLIESVHKYLPSMYKYIKLRKAILKLDEIHMYDIYTPIVSNFEKKYSYEEAKNIVIGALEPMGGDYTAIVKKGLSEKWIDVYENEGKRSGAYSFGSYDSKPFILLNYQDTLDDVFTLIHEMGHSVHSYYSNHNQDYHYANYSIFVAEVASTTNEALLNDYFIKNAESKEEKLYILNHYLEQFRGTIFRQTMFAEFEKEIHKIAESGEAITCERLCQIYGDLNKLYYGNDIINDDNIRYEWARIPHFYYDFYVYQYATGFSAAIAFAKDILSGKTENYLEFLKSGSKDYPINILKNAGVDMAEGDAVESALDIFNKLVDEMAEIMEVEL